GDVYLYISDPSWSFWQFNITGQQVFESQAVVQRAQHILIVNASTVPETSTGTPFPVRVAVYTENNTPANNVTVKVYSNLKIWRSHFNEVSGKTNSSGKIVLSPNITKDSLPSMENVFVKATSTLNYSLVERTQIFVVPKIAQLTMNVSRTVVSNESSITVTGLLRDNQGPIFNKTVTLYINGGKIKSLKTDENGTVKFEVNITTVPGMNIVSLQFDSSGYWPAHTEEELWSVPPLIMKQLKYPSAINVGQSGNITAELYCLYGNPTVYLYIKYSTDIGYARYAMQRINGTDIYYFNTTYHWPGIIDFYLYINDSKGDNITTPVYSILVQQAVPELNSTALIFAGIAIIAATVILRRKR
ncbi:MAG: hypothetical protein GXO25_06430, partial [Euryarchaeota archaeon]|nr:hypothetical protein [Euryarchaeota archaeon]